MQLNITKTPIGSNGILHILKDCSVRFKRASESWPQGVVPTISETEPVYEICARCRGKGQKHGSYVPKGGMAPVFCWQPCDTCDQTGKIGHPFPREIAKLANMLEHKDALQIARTLAGMMLGFKEGK